MTIYDVVKQLIGPITPVGSAHLDKVRYANLNSLIELTDLLLKDIQAVSTLKCQPAVSIANASRCADAALNEWHIWLNEPQSIARFKTIEEAQAYLTARRERYIKSEANASRCADAALNERLKNDPNKRVSNGF